MKRTRRISVIFRRALRSGTSPAQLGWATVIGCVIGCTPFFGFHLPMALVVARLTRLNPVMMYGAAQISFPPLAPMIAFASIQLGEKLLRGEWTGLDYRVVSARPVAQLLQDFLLAWLVGGLVLGLALGVLFAAPVWWIARKRRDWRLAHPHYAVAHAALARAARRYRRAPPTPRFYAWFKYRLDPLYSALAAEIPADSFTLDLGSGLGMLPALLHELGGRRGALGLEHDAAKVAAGRIALAGIDGIELREADITAAEFPPCDNVVLADVLHYFEPEIRRALLARAAAALRPGGRLLIRESDASAARGRVTRFIEWCAVKFGWNRAGGVRHLTREALAADLAALGFAAKDSEVAGNFHPGNRLWVCVREVEVPSREQRVAS